MVESYSKEARIEINAVFDDNEVVEKLAGALRDIDDETSSVNTNIQDLEGSYDELGDAIDSANSEIENSARKLNEEEIAGAALKDQFDSVEDAKRAFAEANKEVGDSADTGSKKLDKESDSAEDTSSSMRKAAVSLRELNEEIGFASDNISRLDKD